MQENAPDRIAETGGSPWPARDTGGRSWPPREPYMAPVSSGEDPNRWSKQSPLSRTPQAADRPKKMELQGRDPSQPEQSGEFHCQTRKLTSMIHWCILSWSSVDTRGRG